MNLLFKRKKSFIVIVSLVTTNLVTYYYTTKKDQSSTETTEMNSAFSDNSNCAVKVKRLGGYNYIRPVLFVDKECESDKLLPIKQNVTTQIDEYKRVGSIQSASIYLKEYTNNEWMAINNDEKFLPGSLMKVPQLIAFLKMEEAHPGVLNSQLLFDKVVDVDKHPKYVSKSIVLGQKYTVKELLKYMIMYSDNNATTLLFSHMDYDIFYKVFTDMGLQAPNLTEQNNPINAKDFSIFMRVLYNSSYLSDKNSEFATELLSKCNFTEGLVSGLPSSVKVAHKFGEAGDPTEKHLCESAIVYLDNNPYILTVMVKGQDLAKLPEIIKEISATVYKDMSAAAKPAL